MRATRTWVATGLVCAAWLAACVGGDDGGAKQSITQLIGPAGGTVELPGGGKVTIPANALSREESIKITKLDDGAVTALPEHMEAAGKPFAFEPHGLTFAQDVKIEIEYEGDDLDVRPMKLPREDADASEWTTVFPSEKDMSAKRVSFDTRSFSVIWAARPRRGSGVVVLPDGAIVEDGGVIPDGGGSGGDAGSAGVGAMDGGGGNSGNAGSGGIPADAWAARYPYYGAQWNDYVSNNGTDVTNAAETACDPMTDGPGYDGCIHGGEIRSLPITGQTSCTGLVISDSLDAFDWTCVADADPVRAVSTGLKAGKYLSDLIDPTTGTWRPNSITVLDDTESVVHTSLAEAWWSNPIVIDNDGIAVGETVEGSIYIVTQDVTADYNISSSKTGFVIMPGASVTPTNGPYAALYLGDPNNSNPNDFNWVEGTIVGYGRPGVSGNEHRFSMLRHITVMPPIDTGFSVYCAKSKIVDFESTDSSNLGILLNGVECAIDGARIHNSTSGIRVGQYFTSSATGPNTIDNVTITGNAMYTSGQAGIAINGQVNGVTLRNITIQDQTGLGIDLAGADHVLEQITIQDSMARMSDAIMIGGTGDRLDGITIHGGNNRGIVLGYYGHRLRNLRLSGMYSWAIDLQQGYENTIADVNISRSGGGIRFYNAYRNRVWDTMIGNVGDPIYGSGTGLETTFTGGAGGEMYRADNILSGVYIVNSGLIGFMLGGSQSNVYQQLTIANSGHENMLNTTPSPVSYGGRGIRLGTSYCKGNSFSNLLLVNNADSGLDINPHITGTAIDWVEDTRFHNVAALHNGKRAYGSLFAKDIGTGIRLGEFAVDVTFSGMLLLANNGVDPEQNCHVFSDSTPKTEPGLTDSSVSFTCAPVGGSTAALDTTATGYGALGPIFAGDTTNTSDTNGGRTFDMVGDLDWTRFDHLSRAWGPEASAFPDPSNWGICRSNGSCRIYDWSLRSTDTEVRAVLTPQSNSVLTHTFWATTQQDCEAIPATWNGSACLSSFLTHASEQMDDGIGNDNLLCESNETCIESTNFGAYQGHGSLVTVGPFSSGVVTGVTMLRYATNGR